MSRYSARWWSWASSRSWEEELRVKVKSLDTSKLRSTVRVFFNDEGFDLRISAEPPNHVGRPRHPDDSHFGGGTAGGGDDDPPRHRQRGPHSRHSDPEDEEEESDDSRSHSLDPPVPTAVRGGSVVGCSLPSMPPTTRGGSLILLPTGTTSPSCLAATSDTSNIGLHVLLASSPQSPAVLLPETIHTLGNLVFPSPPPQPPPAGMDLDTDKPSPQPPLADVSEPPQFDLRRWRCRSSLARSTLRLHGRLRPRCWACPVMLWLLSAARSSCHRPVPRRQPLALSGLRSRLRWLPLGWPPTHSLYAPRPTPGRARVLDPDHIFVPQCPAQGGAPRREPCSAHPGAGRAVGGCSESGATYSCHPSFFRYMFVLTSQIDPAWTSCGNRG
ncbi:hypothetical protein ZWY2020_025500 [Hordeum vulgare]|nr:hypothetical protein ZWY2020_025500 [Hordeum vulgare]